MKRDYLDPPAWDCLDDEQYKVIKEWYADEKKKARIEGDIESCAWAAAVASFIALIQFFDHRHENFLYLLFGTIALILFGGIYMAELYHLMAKWGKAGVLPPERKDGKPLYKEFPRSRVVLQFGSAIFIAWLVAQVLIALTAH